VHIPPTDVANISRFSVAADPQTDKTKLKTGIIAATMGMAKNAIRLTRELTQKDVYRCQKSGPEW
jgi:hypothetical protein